MADKTDIAIVGGEIMSIAFAWRAARDGREVVVFERDNRAMGASIRNFGDLANWSTGRTNAPVGDD